MMRDLEHALAWHVTTAQNILKERNHIIHPLRPAERH
jgi:hypothetical protein